MNQAFIFDVFGTLVDWRTGVAEQARDAFTKQGIEIDAFSFADHWRSLYGPAMDEVRSGTRHYVALDVLHRENLDKTLSAFGLAHALDATACDALNRAWEQLPAWPDVHEGMQRLRPLGFLAPCSNASVALSIRLARFAGLNWDTIAGADLAQNYKPKHAVYLNSAKALGLIPEAVVMVAAHNDDLAAAQQAGLRTAFIPRVREHGEGQVSDLKAEGNWDYVADSLTDLARQVESQT